MVTAGGGILAFGSLYTLWDLLSSQGRPGARFHGIATVHSSPRSPLATETRLGRSIEVTGLSLTDFRVC